MESVQSTGRFDADEGIQRVAVVGCGLIGARWAALFLARGLDVVAFDPAEGAYERLNEDMRAAWPALVELGQTKLEAPPSLAFAATLGDAVENADWVQENVPDYVQLKLDVIQQIDAACPPSAIIASSTSGIPPSTLQSVCTQPERVLIGHPFNPVHIMPLIEVVPSEQTAGAVVDRAMSFYEALGKKPLRVAREVPGFVVNRIQEAILREAFSMVAEGVATTADIDFALTNGPGLRLAFIGPCMVNHLTGGRGGMAATLEQFDFDAIADWSVAPPPPMTDELRRRLIEGTAEQSKGRSIAEWEALRDSFLIRLLQLRAAPDFRI